MTVILSKEINVIKNRYKLFKNVLATEMPTFIIWSPTIICMFINVLNMPSAFHISQGNIVMTICEALGFIDSL